MLASEYFEQEKLDEMALGLFEEMCRRVGTTLDDPKLDVGEKKPFIWKFDAYEWTEKEEEDFRKWALDYIYKRRKGRGLYTKKHINSHFLPYWLLQYSWRYKK